MFLTNGVNKMNKILVVGGAGYIGGALTDYFKVSQWKATVYDSLLYENLYLKPVDFVHGDIRDTVRLRAMINDFDTVIWLAAIVGDGACAVNPEETSAINDTAVKWLVDNYQGKIIFTSTCSVYGANHDHNLTELTKTNPLSLYAATKLKAEEYLMARKAPTIIFRLGTVHGLGDNFSRIRLDLVTNILTLKASRGHPLTIFGGSQWRPIIHVRDVAQALYCATALWDAHSLNSGIYNLASENIEIKELGLAIKKQIPSTKIKYVDLKFEDLRNYHVSTEKYQKEFHLNHRVTLEDSIAELAQFYVSGRIRNADDPLYNNRNYLQWKKDN